MISEMRTTQPSSVEGSTFLAKDTSVAALQAEVERLRTALFSASEQHTALVAEVTQLKGANQQLQFDNDSFQRRLTASQEAEEAKDARIEELAQENHDLQEREQQAVSDRDALAAENSQLKAELAQAKLPFPTVNADEFLRKTPQRMRNHALQ